VVDHSYTLEELLENQSFRRWAKGRANEEEKVYWDDWVMNRKENRKTARTALATLSGFSLDSLTSSDARQAWGRFHERLDQECGTINKRIRGDESSRISGRKWIYRVAAGILVILSTGLTIYFGYPTLQNQAQMASYPVEQEINTDYGERKNIKMTDGSVIILNANSALVYSNDPLHPTNIEVYLQGEAFFSVTHRESPDEYPFRVHTEDGTVRVLGTEFAVSTRDDKTRVVLEEGSVEVNPADRTGDNPGRAVLEPSQMAEFDSQSETLIIKPVNAKVYTSWKTRKLVFDRTPLAEVLKRIEYTFGVDVKVKNSSLYEQTLSGTIENTEMSVILPTLSKVISAPVKVQGTTVYVGKSPAIDAMK